MVVYIKVFLNINLFKNYYHKGQIKDLKPHGEGYLADENG